MFGVEKVHGNQCDLGIELLQLKFQRLPITQHLGESQHSYPARKWRECWWNVIFLYPLLPPPKKKFTQAKRKKDPNKRMGAMDKLKKLWIQLARHRTFGPLASLLTRADRMVFFSTSTYWRPEIHGFCIKVYKWDLVEKPLSFHIIPLYWLVKNGKPQLMHGHDTVTPNIRSPVENHQPTVVFHGFERTANW